MLLVKYLSTTPQVVLTETGDEGNIYRSMVKVCMVCRSMVHSLLTSGEP